MINLLKFFLFILRRVLFFLPFQEVSVLVYHSIGDDKGDLTISKETFEKHLKYLKEKGFYFANFLELAEYIEGRRDLPLKTIVLTFDDGYEDLYLNAFSVLKKYSIPFGIFIISDFLNKKDGGKAYLDQGQIDEMVQGGAEIGFHTKSHKDLTKISSADMAREIHSGMKSFAYPYGVFSDNVVEAVKEAGYRVAFSVKFGLVKRGDDSFKIRRNVIMKRDPLWVLGFKTSMAAGWYRKITNLLK